MSMVGAADAAYAGPDAAAVAAPNAASHKLSRASRASMRQVRADGDTKPAPFPRPISMSYFDSIPAKADAGGRHWNSLALFEGGRDRTCLTDTSIFMSEFIAPNITFQQQLSLLSQSTFRGQGGTQQWDSLATANAPGWHYTFFPVTKVSTAGGVFSCKVMLYVVLYSSAPVTGAHLGHLVAHTPIYQSVSIGGNRPANVNIDVALIPDAASSQASVLAALDNSNPTDGWYLTFIPYEHIGVQQAWIRNSREKQFEQFGGATTQQYHDLDHWRISGSSLGLAVYAAVHGMPSVAYTGYISNLGGPNSRIGSVGLVRTAASAGIVETVDNVFWKVAKCVKEGFPIVIPAVTNFGQDMREILLGYGGQNPRNLSDAGLISFGQEGDLFTMQMAMDGINYFSSRWSVHVAKTVADVGLLAAFAGMAWFGGSADPNSMASGKARDDRALQTAQKNYGVRLYIQHRVDRANANSEAASKLRARLKAMTDAQREQYFKDKPTQNADRYVAKAKQGLARLQASRIQQIEASYKRKASGARPAMSKKTAFARDKFAGIGQLREQIKKAKLAGKEAYAARTTKKNGEPIKKLTKEQRQMIAAKAQPAQALARRKKAGVRQAWQDQWFPVAGQSGLLVTNRVPPRFRLVRGKRGQAVPVAAQQLVQPLLSDEGSYAAPPVPSDFAPQAQQALRQQISDEAEDAAAMRAIAAGRAPGRLLGRRDVGVRLRDEASNAASRLQPRPAGPGETSESLSENESGPEAADQFGAAGPFVGIDQFGDRRGGGSSDYPSMVSGGKNAIRMLSGFGASPDPRIASQVRRGARYEGAGQFGADGFFSTLGSAAGGLIDRIF